jgi:hypothetical protein
MASLPGIRAKQFAGDAQTRSTSNRIDLPPDWQGTTGGVPGKSLELFVLEGMLRLADVELGPGGYAFVPPGSIGFNMQTDGGARILYFADNVDPLAMIRTPIILDTGLVGWQTVDDSGTTVKELRSDPGSGARTWLWRVTPGTRLPWQTSNLAREGFLVSGQFRDSECVNGEPYTGIYVSGGYFMRPAGAIYGGAEAAALAEAVWLLRETGKATLTDPGGCTPAPD